MLVNRFKLSYRVADGYLYRWSALLVSFDPCRKVHEKIHHRIPGKVAALLLFHWYLSALVILLRASLNIILSRRRCRGTSVVRKMHISGLLDDSNLIHISYSNFITVWIIATMRLWWLHRNTAVFLAGNNFNRDHLSEESVACQCYRLICGICDTNYHSSMQWGQHCAP